MSLRRLSRPLGLALSGLLATAALALVPATAQARVPAPTGLSPSGPTSSSTPTFTWNRVTGATQYELVISVGGNPVLQTATANNRYVPTSNLPDGAISWQVRADTLSGNSAWASADATVSATAAPSPISPVGGELLTQPDNPPLFTWSAVAGATGYELQVDNTGSWTSPTTYAPSGTSYFVSAPQAPGTWYWRVRASRGNGLYTAWSNTATYDVGQLDDPVPGADMTGAPMQDVSIDWQPVPGATDYQLQVGKDPDFNNIVDDRTVFGTRFQPSTTYNNDQYYWRVRAYDASGNPAPWTATAPFTFQRNWPQKPTLEYPLNQFAPTVGNPMFYQWTAVRRASQYQLDVGSDPNFSPGTFARCYTTFTTFPVNGNCAPLGQGATTYWRVKGLDNPTGVEGIFSDIHHFVYSGGKITQTSPADGDTVDVPTLTWDPIGGTQSYHVVIRDKDNHIVAGIDTSSTSWTPEDTALDPAGNPYTWTVQSTPYQGNISPLYPGISFNVSGNDPTLGTPLVPLTGLAGDPATAEFPDLTWGAQSGAKYYRVRIGVQGSGFYDIGVSHISDAAYAYPAATDTGTHYLSPGTYFWYVDAYDASNHLLGETSPADYGQFTIKDLPDASGQKIALDGLADLSPSSGCTNALANSDPNTQICVGVPGTPVLTWDAQPRAAGYIVYLANDRELTNRVVNPYAVTTNTMWTPPNDLPDNTAQGSYYWYVRPCKSMGPQQCNPDPISTNAAATNAFRKLSPAVQLGAPADNATLTTEPTFSWTDYYDTNQTVSYAGGADKSYQTAQMYRIQVSQSSTFPNNGSTPVDTNVDQPFYTPSTLTLPQGKLYWRVQVIDPSNNRVNWSAVRSFTNNQPAVDLSPSGAVPSPVGGVTVAGSTPFRWAPMDGAYYYSIEVYKNDDSTHSPANLVIAANTQEPAYVWQNYLPPSTSAYRWRVRWTDAGNQLRPYSADGRFFVNASSVTLTSPATGTLQKNNNLYFTWNAVPLAANYRLEVRDANNNNVYQPVTPATANAPTVIGDGVYTWRVTALDPSGGAIATSAWRTFTVDATAPIVTKVTPTPYGKPGSRLTVTFSEKVAGVTAKSFQLHPYLKKSKLAAKVKLSSNGKVATLTPKAKLKKGHAYTGTVTGTIHDAAGNHLVTASWSFSV